jgi:Flp pilus assembly protein TadD
MARIEKTVFLSYRRTNVPWALAIYKELTHHGYDVFFDFEGIGSGDFEQVILENIRSRAHFLIVLTPSALERCDSPDDWLRREIETALDAKRNVVPLMMEGFDFGTPAISRYLTGKMSGLKAYNALSIPVAYFDAAMERLRDKYLNVALDAVLHPVSGAARQAAKSQQTAATAAPKVIEEELSAQEWFERGFKAGKPDEKIQCYSEAIRLKPDYASAYNNRGVARDDRGDLAGAIRDYSEAIRLKPNYADAYNNRGVSRKRQDDLAGAIQDFNEAILLKPDYTDAYYNRGVARVDRGDFRGAIQDYSEAIHLKPDYASAYYNRGIAFKNQGDIAVAILDYQKYLDLGGGILNGDQAQVKDMIRDLARKLSTS